MVYKWRGLKSMKSEKSADREECIVNKNMSARNRIFGASSVGAYFEIFILLLGLAALILSIALPTGRYIIDYTNLHASYPDIYSIYKYIVIAVFLFSMLAANTITKKNYPKRYKYWRAISSVLIFVSFLTSTLFVKSIF